MKIEKPVYAWYAVYTKTNHEKRIIANLEEEGIECYLPLWKSLKQWSDRKKWIEEPLFRSYIFVRVSYVEFYNVLNIPGAFCYVSFGGRPQTIPDFQIKNIRAFIKQEEKSVVLTRENMAKGIKIEVKYGPLKGVQGEVVQICGQSRILVRIESMGCCLHTNISNNEIKIIKQNSAKKNTQSKSSKRLINTI